MSRAPLVDSPPAGDGAARWRAHERHLREVRRGLIQAPLLVYLRAVRSSAVDAAAALYTVRQAIRRLAAARDLESQRAAVAGLLEVWPRADRALRVVVVALLSGREALVCAEVLADACDEAEDVVEVVLAGRSARRAKSEPTAA